MFRNMPAWPLEPCSGGGGGPRGGFAALWACKFRNDKCFCRVLLPQSSGLFNAKAREIINSSWSPVKAQQGGVDVNVRNLQKSELPLWRPPMFWIIVQWVFTSMLAP